MYFHYSRRNFTACICDTYSSSRQRSAAQHSDAAGGRDINCDGSVDDDFVFVAACLAGSESFRTYHFFMLLLLLCLLLLRRLLRLLLHLRPLWALMTFKSWANCCSFCSLLFTPLPLMYSMRAASAAASAHHQRPSMLLADCPSGSVLRNWRKGNECVSE